jgi:hypothetical protein
MAEATGHLFMDRTPPNSFTPTPEPPGWTRYDPVVTFDAMDDSSGIKGYYLKVDDDQFAKAKSPYTLTQLPDGRHNVTVRAFDIAGNHVDGSVEVLVDRQPPLSVSVIINGGKETTDVRQARLFIFAQDLSSGPGQMCFSPDGASYSEWEPFAPNKLWTLPPGRGEKTVFVKVRDTAGNEAKAAQATIRYDPSGDTDILPVPVFVSVGTAIAAVIGAASWYIMSGRSRSMRPKGLK